jgi:hypothetical protein
LVCAKSAVRLLGHPSCDDLPDGRVVHEPHEDLFVLVHALDEKALKQIPKDQLELILGVHGSSLKQPIVGDCSLDDLVEEELVRLIEIRPKVLVEELTNETRPAHSAR